MAIIDAIFGDSTLKVRLWIRAIMYIVSALIGIAIAISMGVARGAFRGNCILYGSCNPRGRLLLYIFGSPSHCNFIIGMNAVLTVIIPVGLAIVFILITLKKLEIDLTQFVMSLGVFVYSVIASLLCIVSAGMATAGYNAWCSTVVTTMKFIQPGYHWTCEQVPLIFADDPKSEIMYHGPMKAVIGLSWANVVVWIGICVGSALAFYASLRMRNSGNGNSDTQTDSRVV
ncbi:unnamed protein product [Owenia fusiformis]|uniref:Uncharacterized protein n=1 Tax=Owenia fusiformis TaxID=6347 RepID=A0A8J1Y9Y0_OWEFU|nr:unnamed protein product [Owenia fusiformis]